jgi:NADH-quinone oxidoreductase subunit L
MTLHQFLLLGIFLFPLGGAILNGFFLRKVHRHVTTAVGTSAIAIPFLMSLYLAVGPIYAGDVVHVRMFDWITLSLKHENDFRLSFGLTVDRLSSVMLLVITGVGSLIHLYSGEYMSHEKGVYRFFAYLNLFVFSMLALVLGSNMLTTFLGWEGVGLCSYLLIGYWYEGESNAAAGMKAFIVNRIGDFGFLIAMFLCLMLFGTIDYTSAGGATGLTDVIANLSPEWFSQNATLITLTSLSILVAVTGKSAQMPLYIWLPDAMAGPTPVSALIHAATMVTAGVYFMTRTSFLLVHSPVAMTVIATVGAVTAVFAATIGFAQTDIKKVLAYSTVSQLGFMVLACGVGAFQFGIAHLVTHAFFKALLFLGAGSVIYAMHHEQDIMKFGGLLKKLPITGATFIVGTLAIIGFPLMAGFMSKDEILYNAWAGPFGHPIFWIVGAIAAGGTAFYMTRLTLLTFFGKTRADHHTYEHCHENNWQIVLPLSILAILSIVGGIISVPGGIGELFGHHGENFITEWLAPVLEPAQKYMEATHGEHAHNGSLEWTLMATSFATMLAMVSLAWWIYKDGVKKGEIYALKMGGFYRLIRDKWRIDELYNVAIVTPLRKVADLCYQVGDLIFVEGTVNGVPRLMKNVTQIASDMQGGMVRTYAKAMFIGILALSAILYWSLV